jgi:hypothetical protein
LVACITIGVEIVPLGVLTYQMLSLVGWVTDVTGVLVKRDSPIEVFIAKRAWQSLGVCKDEACHSIAPSALGIRVSLEVCRSQRYNSWIQSITHQLSLFRRQNADPFDISSSMLISLKISESVVKKSTP